MLTENVVKSFEYENSYDVFKNIFRCLDFEKINKTSYKSLILKEFEKACLSINYEEELKPRMAKKVNAFRVINDNLHKCYVEVVPETDGNIIYKKEKYHLNIAYDDFFPKKQMESTGALELFYYLKLKRIDRTTKTIYNLEFSRYGIKVLDNGNTQKPIDNKKMEVVEKIVKHYSQLYTAKDKEVKELVFFDLIELLRTRPRDKALWFNLGGGFGKDVLITFLARFWNARVFTKDINDSMSNAPRVREEREIDRTNAEIWNRPELRQDATRKEIEERVQSIKTHTGRTSDILEISGDIRVNSAFTIETTNADLQLRNEMDVVRRFIIFKLEADMLLNSITSDQVEKFISGYYNNEIEFLYYMYCINETNKGYLERLKKYSTPIEEVIDDEMRNARDVIPNGWKNYKYIPKMWIDSVMEKNEKIFTKYMPLKDKMAILGLGKAESASINYVNVDRENRELKESYKKTTTVRLNKNAKENAIMPEITQFGTFKDGVFYES